MTRTKKLLVTGLIAFLIVTGGGFYYFYFMSMDAAIRKAEAFGFQRMAVSRVGDDDFRLFFVTNRREEPGSESLEQRFGKEREEMLKFGAYDVSFEPSVGLGKFLDSMEWFQNDQIQLNSIQQMEKGDFIESIKKLVDKSPEHSLLVLVNGFRDSFESALRKSAFVSTVLDIDTPVLVFDWPGNQGSSLRGYRQARSVATASGAELAETLEIIIRDIQPDRVSLMANSMGGQVVVDAFSELYEQADLADADKEFDHIVLTAPDVDHADFNTRFADEIKAMANDLTVYLSSNDRALLISRVINRGQRAGESTISSSQFEEAISLSRLVEPDSDLINLVDVTPVNRTRNFHNFSLETPEFFDDLYLRLTSDDYLAQNRRIYRIQAPNDRVYWVLTHGR